MTENRPELQPEKNKGSKVFSFTLFTELALEIAVILAAPLIGAIYLGKWLDAKYDTGFFLVACVLLALALSWYAVIKKIMAIKKLVNK